jgi:spore germination cell wall hydrolase CwlJ-like protein
LKSLTATFAAAFLALSIAGTAHADERKMDALRERVSVLPEALGLQNTNRREFLCLSLAIYFEARGEPALGKAAVAHVVYNRSLIRSFPETICGVVWQRGQFGWAPRPINTLVPHDPVAWLESQRIAYAIYKHPENDPTGGATYFYGTHEHRPKWANKANHVWKSGGHVFCAMPGTKRTADIVLAKNDNVMLEKVSVNVDPIGDIIEKQN